MLPEDRIEKWFIYSSMTVRNEVSDAWKYYELEYVEYLELICRASIYFQPKLPIYESVYNMLEHLEGIYKLGFPIKKSEPAKELEYRKRVSQLSKIIKSDKSGQI